mmetsp:Transcript_4957/g.15073  ORF Transcript_4957/g.15073 Transcript_4957/m.15073 type:complete len:116 (+) Transcript_4957:573-920(+)
MVGRRWRGEAGLPECPPDYHMASDGSHRQALPLARKSPVCRCSNSGAAPGVSLGRIASPMRVHFIEELPAQDLENQASTKIWHVGLGELEARSTSEVLCCPAHEHTTIMAVVLSR